MIAHYLKVALRSLMKYKMQTAVSIVGLAVGFVCFAFSMIWIRYELTYDSFHPGAERIYLVCNKTLRGYSSNNNYGLAAELKEKFPEVECTASFTEGTLQLDDTGAQPKYLDCLSVESSFIEMFGVKLLSGSWDFLHSDEKQMAVTRETALYVFGTENVLGKELDYMGTPYTIAAVVEGWGKHTNIPYDVIIKLIPSEFGADGYYTTCIRLNKGADSEAFASKLKHYRSKNVSVDLTIERLMHCSYTVFKPKNSLSMTSLRFFVIIGLLVILSALFNYFSIMVSRILIRARELALRVVCGSSRRGLFALFGTEMFLLLAVSGLLSMVTIELVTPKFSELSGVEGSIVYVSFCYFLVVFLLSMFFAYGLIEYYSRRSLMSVLHSGTPVVGRRVNFHQFSTCIQFVVSVVVLFVLSVVQMQIYHLRHVDIGFERKGRAAALRLSDELQYKLIQDLQKLPYVTEVHKDMFILFPLGMVLSREISTWDGKQADDSPVALQVVPRSEEFLRFYGIRLLQGRSRYVGSDEILLNEAAVRAFGWHNPLGKKLDRYTVVGVVKDIHTSSPLLSVEPMMFENPSYGVLKGRGNVQFRFDEEYTEELKRFSKEWSEKNVPDKSEVISILNEEYEAYLTAERSMSRLLGIITVVCVIVTLFGVYSHVTLSCERRRKEIAIRKVNGATSADIIRSFLRQYFYLLLFSCVIALPLGTFVMLHWLEQYVERTPLYWWIYAGIVAVMYVFVVLCIGRSVWRAANENPAEVIKSE